MMGNKMDAVTPIARLLLWYDICKMMGGGLMEEASPSIRNSSLQKDEPPPFNGQPRRAAGRAAPPVERVAFFPPSREHRARRSGDELPPSRERLCPCSPSIEQPRA